jgi:hypothetical protein
VSALVSHDSELFVKPVKSINAKRAIGRWFRRNACPRISRKLVGVYAGKSWMV